MYKSLVFGDEFLAQGLHLQCRHRMSIISCFNTYMFYQIKRTALLEFIPLIDVSISIGTVELKADEKD